MVVEAVVVVVVVVVVVAVFLRANRCNMSHSLRQSIHTLMT